MPENTLCKALWTSHLRGYRRNVRLGRSKPDVYFSRFRLAVFINGCFWHGCPLCKKDAVFKSNEAFWTEKIASTRKRDALAYEELSAKGIRVLVVWECELKRDILAVVSQIRSSLGPYTAPIHETVHPH